MGQLHQWMKSKTRTMVVLVMGTPFLLIMSLAALFIDMMRPVASLILWVCFGLLLIAVWRRKGLYLSIFGLGVLVALNQELFLHKWYLCFLGSVILGWGIFLLGQQQLCDWLEQRQTLLCEIEKKSALIADLSREIREYQNIYTVCYQLENQVTLLQKQIEELGYEQWSDVMQLQTQYADVYEDHQRMNEEMHELEMIATEFITKTSRSKGS